MAVRKEYCSLIERFGSELYILLELDLKRKDLGINKRIIQGIKRVRAGKLAITPGFDGQYGEIKIFAEDNF